jgi:aldose 1-epimerase
MPVEPLSLKNSRTGASASILPAAGFTCYALRLPVGSQTVDVLDGEPDFSATGEHPTRNGIPLLFPFPNRIRGARYHWGGKDYDLSGIHQDGQGNAIHGLVVDRAWRVIDRREDRVIGQFHLSVDAPDRRSVWPADFLIEVGYELQEAGLRCKIRIENPSPTPLPWGFGTHPYFRIPLTVDSDRDQCLVQAPAAEEWELAHCLPTGRRRSVTGTKDLREGQPLAGLKLDDVLTDLASQAGQTTSVVMDPAAGLQIRQVTDAAFRELVVYTPPHGRSVCLEPYTCATDAIHLANDGIDAGLQILAPGGEFRTWFEIRAERVYA